MGTIQSYATRVLAYVAGVDSNNLVGKALIRQILTADSTYYVRTDGSDSNTGLTNTAGGAWLTITHALNYVSQKIDGGGFNVTIQVADGTYTQAAPYEMTGFVGIQQVLVQGNLGDKTAVHITSSSATILFVWFVLNSPVQFSFVKVSNTAGNIFAPNVASQLVLDNIYWGPNIGYCIWAASNSNVELTNAHSIDTGASGAWFILCSDQSFVSLEPSTVLTVVGTPAFADAFVWVNRNAVVSLQNATIVNGAAATGSRRVLASAGIIDATGLTGAMPGSSAGFNLDGTGIYITVAGVSIASGIAEPALPVVTPTADYTVLNDDRFIINNKTGSTNTMTLPVASSNLGRVLTIKTIQAFTVISASSNVVSRAGSSTGTAILSGSTGQWAQLVSDGTNWVIMEGS